MLDSKFSDITLNQIAADHICEERGHLEFSGRHLTLNECAEQCSIQVPNATYLGFKEAVSAEEEVLCECYSSLEGECILTSSSRWTLYSITTENFSPPIPTKPTASPTATLIVIKSPGWFF